MRLAGHRFLSLYGLFVACSMIVSLIPIFGAVISGLLGPALAYVLPMEAALVLPILSLLVAMSLGFRDLTQLGGALFMFPSDFLGIWAFCKLRDRGMRFGALLVYWAIHLIFFGPIYFISGLFMAQVNVGIAQEAVSVLGIDPNATVSMPLMNAIAAVMIGMVIIMFGVMTWTVTRALRSYIKGMRMLFKRLDPIRMQLKQIRG